MRKKITVILFCVYCVCVQAQVQYTQIFDNNIKTLEISENAIIQLNSDEILKINFDELSYQTKNFSYKITYCNADWTPSNLAEFEYLTGINWADIDEAQQSINTTFYYTHYKFYFPNEQLKPKISGNYIISVFESTIPDKILFQLRFCVWEKEANIVAKVRTNTDFGVNTKFQQIDFDVVTEKNISDPFSEIKVCIKQNRRTDNEVSNIKPSFISGKKLTFSNNPKLIFEGGNEYRSFDIANIRILDDGIRKIQYFEPYYHVDIQEDKFRSGKSYQFRKDINGRFVINLQRNNYEKELEADYMFVHFSLPKDAPFFDGRVFVTGDFNLQLLNKNSEMKYNNDSKSYIHTELLKQGGYNYQYLFVQKGETKGNSALIEGSFWETENEYEIFVYHRPIGSRYDKLIGYQSLRAN